MLVVAPKGAHKCIHQNFQVPILSRPLELYWRISPQPSRLILPFVIVSIPMAKFLSRVSGRLAAFWYVLLRLRV